ncbi:hypothetical protein ABIA85_009722, partial [Bradyrhizobium sp. LA6.10]|uniref:hypothetical protein n=1 Tax=unclassified Bradyrhizobium TaxID=2631580 RepID=UPI00339B458E
GNHESPKSKILKRKKARSNTPLSCKIEYYIKTNSAYFSDQSAFFTDDDLLFRKPAALHALVLVLSQNQLQTGLSPLGKVTFIPGPVVGRSELQKQIGCVTRATTSPSRGRLQARTVCILNK